MKNNSFFSTAKEESNVCLNTLLDETDWYDEKRFEVLYQLNLAKFSQNHHLKEALSSTVDRDIIALSTKLPWYTIAYDTKKGSYGGNRLGKMMMQVRNEIKNCEISAKNKAHKQIDHIGVEYTAFNPGKDASHLTDDNLKLLHRYGVDNQWEERKVVIFPQSNDWLSNRYVCNFEVDKEEYDSTEKAFQIAKVDYAIEQQSELQLNEKEIAALAATKKTMQSMSSGDRIKDIIDQAKKNQFRSLEQRREQQSPKPK